MEIVKSDTIGYVTDDYDILKYDIKDGLKPVVGQIDGYRIVSNGSDGWVKVGKGGMKMATRKKIIEMDRYMRAEFEKIVLDK